MAPSIYFIDREQSTTLQDIGVYSWRLAAASPASGQPEHVEGLDVTDGALPLLGVKPALGRLFTRRDDTPGVAETVMLSYGYWQRRFGGSSSVIGRTLTIDGKPHEIIGVLPRGFHFLDIRDGDCSLPMQLGPQQDQARQLQLQRARPAEARRHHAAGQRRHGAPDSHLPSAASPRPMASAPALFEKATFKPTLQPLKQDVVGDVGNVLWVLMGSIVRGAADCLRQRRQPAAGARGRPPAGTRHPLRAGRGLRSASLPDLLFESAVLGLTGKRCSASRWPMARCASWWRWRPPACRACMRSASIFRCCSSRSALRCSPACSSASFRCFKYAGAHSAPACAKADAR